VAAQPPGDRGDLLAGRIDGDFLWWGVTRENNMPASTTVAVLVDGSPVFSTVRQAEELAAALAAGTRKDDDRSSGLRWRVDGEPEVASYWKVPLSVRFGSGDWTVVWSRPEAAFLAPVERFERLFALVLSATLLATLAVAAWQIRRFFVPLNRLREGTRRIASHDFATPVEVSTDDEFGDLAGSFNEMARQLDELVEDLRRHQLGTLRALARAIDERSPWTLGHSGRVARLVNQLAQRLGVASADRWDLHRAALLHDIGKLSIESDLLDQPGRLTPEQRSLIEQHVGAGVRILEPVPGYERIRPIVAQHHERLDGSGYPLGLRGEQIGLGARVLAVADCFDALSSDRPYRPGLPIGEVVEELRRGAGRLYDAGVVEALEDLLADGLPDDSWPGEPRRALTARAPSTVAKEAAPSGGTNPARST
jgi:putative nucleotidyltransferase with HDIG domain